jgi:hypothetical protein
MALRTVIDLGNTPIIKDILSRLTDLRGRFASVESVQAQIKALAQQALDLSQNPRTIKSVAIVGGHLIVTFSDGTTQDAGPIGVALNTILNTLAGSTLPSAQVEGEPAIYAALYPRLSAVKAQILAARDRRIALTARVVVLESGTPSTSATPTPTNDPTYDPAATVVVNAQRCSDFLDAVIALAASEEIAWAGLIARIAARENPPAPIIPTTAIANDNGGYVLNDAGGYVLTGA